eukprot:4249070-Alexandrium_andersonii.AAC.1
MNEIHRTTRTVLDRAGDQSRNEGELFSDLEHADQPKPDSQLFRDLELADEHQAAIALEALKC